MAYKFHRDPENSPLDAYLQATPSPAFHGTDYLSIFARFNAENVDDNHTIATLRFTDTNGKLNMYLLRACGELSGDPVRFTSTSEGADYYIDSATGFSASTWHTVIATANRADTKLFLSLDGGAFAAKSSAKFPNGNPWFVQLSGAMYYRAIAGSLAEIALYNIDLAASAYAADVAALAKGFSPASIRPQNLLAYWPLVRGLQDLKGGRTLTAYNDPVVVEHPRVIA